MKKTEAERLSNLPKIIQRQNLTLSLVNLVSTSKAHFSVPCSIQDNKDAQKEGRAKDNGKDDIRNKHQHKPSFPQY